MSTRLSNALERPPSEQLADLHVYVIPIESWNDKFHSAYNEVINESVSAGFVRVFPEITIYSLRDEIEEQLGYDVLPKDYVFLKSVGRCLAQVKGRQEIELKVKNFLPPLAYLPEIFLLPGHRDHVPLALPSTENYKSQRHRPAAGGRASKHESTQTGPSPDLRVSHDSRLDEIDSQLRQNERQSVVHSGAGKHHVGDGSKELASNHGDTGAQKQTSTVVDTRKAELGKDGKKIVGAASVEAGGVKQRVASSKGARQGTGGVRQTVTTSDERQVRQNGLKALKSKISLRISNGDSPAQNVKNNAAESSSSNSKHTADAKSTMPVQKPNQKVVDEKKQKQKDVNEKLHSDSVTADKETKIQKVRTQSRDKGSSKDVAKSMPAESQNRKVPLKAGRNRKNVTPFKEWKTKQGSKEKPAELPRWQFSFKTGPKLSDPPKKWERTNSIYKKKVKNSMKKHLIEFGKEKAAETESEAKKTTTESGTSAKVKDKLSVKTRSEEKDRNKSVPTQNRSVVSTRSTNKSSISENSRTTGTKSLRTSRDSPLLKVLTPKHSDSEPVKKVVRIVSALNQEIDIPQDDDEHDLETGAERNLFKYRRKSQQSSVKSARSLSKDSSGLEKEISSLEEKQAKERSTGEALDRHEEADEFGLDGELTASNHSRKSSHLTTIYESYSGEIRESESELCDQVREGEQEGKIPQDRAGSIGDDEGLERGRLQQEKMRTKTGDVDGFSQPGRNSATPDPFSIEHHQHNYPHKTPVQEDGQEGYLPPLSATPPQTPDVVPVESPLQRKTKVAGKDANRSGRSDTYTNNTNEDSGIADDVEEELERPKQSQEKSHAQSGHSGHSGHSDHSQKHDTTHTADSHKPGQATNQDPPGPDSPGPENSIHVHRPSSGSPSHALPHSDNQHYNQPGPEKLTHDQRGAGNLIPDDQPDPDSPSPSHNEPDPLNQHLGDPVDPDHENMPDSDQPETDDYDQQTSRQSHDQNQRANLTHSGPTPLNGQHDPNHGHSQSSQSHRALHHTRNSVHDHEPRSVHTDTFQETNSRADASLELTSAAMAANNHADTHGASLFQEAIRDGLDNISQDSDNDNDLWKRREQEEEERRRREEQERLRHLEEERRAQRRRQQQQEEEEEDLRHQEEMMRRELEDRERMQRLERAEREARERLKHQEEEREREDLERQRQQIQRLQEEQRAREQREQERRNREEMEQRQRELEEQIREEDERKREEEERRKHELLQKQQQAFPSAPEKVSSRKNRVDTDSAKERRREEKERLLDDLQRARDDRQGTEREREDLVRRAKALQNKTQNKRNRARDAWKKKYFEEKKKTPPLEQEVNKLRHSLDLQHKKYVNQIEGKEARRKNAYSHPSEKANLKVQIAKNQHDLEELRRRVENTKMKLTTEMKLRNQAETELRALRAELTQKKINVTLSRSQQLQALQESEEGMSYMSPRSPLPTRRPGGPTPRVQ